jgi:type II secretory pathway pseudopilin PulG
MQHQNSPHKTMGISFHKLALLFASAERNQGLTLIEALVAMIIITVVTLVITPPVFMAVATRVQNTRTEQAMQLAQREIERVRYLMFADDLPSLDGKTQDGLANATPEKRLPPVAKNIFKDALAANVAAPLSECTPSTGLCSTSQYWAIDKDFIIQTFRDQGVCVTNTTGKEEIVAFRMGVRVYSSAAKAEAAKGTLRSERTVRQFTGSGLGERILFPLAASYTELGRSSAAGSLTKYQSYQKDNNTATMGLCTKPI